MVKDDDKLSSELQCSIENEIKRLISVSSLVIIFKVEHACMDDQHKCFFFWGAVYICRVTEMIRVTKIFPGPQNEISINFRMILHLN